MATTTSRAAAKKVQRDAEKLLEDLGELVRAKGMEITPEIKALRDRIENSVVQLRDSAQEVVQETTTQVREATKAANAYAHDEPWRMAGVALAVGAVLGFILGRR